MFRKLQEYIEVVRNKYHNWTFWEMDTLELSVWAHKGKWGCKTNRKRDDDISGMIPKQTLCWRVLLHISCVWNQHDPFKKQSCHWSAEDSYLVAKLLEVIEAALHHNLHKLLNGRSWSHGFKETILFKLSHVQGAEGNLEVVQLWLADDPATNYYKECKK